MTLALVKQKKFKRTLLLVFKVVYICIAVLQQFCGDFSHCSNTWRRLSSAHYNTQVWPLSFTLQEYIYCVFVNFELKEFKFQIFSLRGYFILPKFSEFLSRVGMPVFCPWCCKICIHSPLEACAYFWKPLLTTDIFVLSIQLLSHFFG